MDTHSARSWRSNAVRIVGGGRVLSSARHLGGQERSPSAPMASAAATPPRPIARNQTLNARRELDLRRQGEPWVTNMVSSPIGLPARPSRRPPIRRGPQLPIRRRQPACDCSTFSSCLPTANPGYPPPPDQFPPNFRYLPGYHDSWPNRDDRRCLCRFLRRTVCPGWSNSRIFVMRLSVDDH